MGQPLHLLSPPASSPLLVWPYSSVSAGSPCRTAPRPRYLRGDPGTQGGPVPWQELGPCLPSLWCRRLSGQERICLPNPERWKL